MTKGFYDFDFDVDDGVIAKNWGVDEVFYLRNLRSRKLYLSDDANLISVIFVFTFVYSIILYAFSKVIEGNVLVFNCMAKTSCFRSVSRPEIG